MRLFAKVLTVLLVATALLGASVAQASPRGGFSSGFRGSSYSYGGFNRGFYGFNSYGFAAPVVSSFYTAPILVQAPIQPVYSVQYSLPVQAFAAPQYAAPQFAAPQYAAPQYAAPQVAAPQFAAPQYAAPQVAAPVYAAPQYAAPQFAAPLYSAPSYSVGVSYPYTAAFFSRHYGNHGHGHRGRR